MGKPSKIVQLIQSPREKAVIVNLEEEEKGILTGEMGGCYSVVILWNHYDINDPNSKVGYSKVRGHHAGGGAGNLNWDMLLEGVSQECVIVASSDKENAKHEEKGLVEQINLYRPNAIKHLHEFADAYIDRNANVFEASVIYNNKKDYEIRNEGKGAIY